MARCWAVGSEAASVGLREERRPSVCPRAGSGSGRPREGKAGMAAGQQAAGQRWGAAVAPRGNAAELG